MSLPETPETGETHRRCASFGDRIPEGHRRLDSRRELHVIYGGEAGSKTQLYAPIGSQLARWCATAVGLGANRPDRRSAHESLLLGRRARAASPNRRKRWRYRPLPYGSSRRPQEQQIGEIY